MVYVTKKIVNIIAPGLKKVVHNNIARNQKSICCLFWDWP